MMACNLRLFIYSGFIIAEEKAHICFKMFDIDQLILILTFRFGDVLV